MDRTTQLRHLSPGDTAIFHSGASATLIQRNTLRDAQTGRLVETVYTFEDRTGAHHYLRGRELDQDVRIADAVCECGHGVIDGENGSVDTASGIATCEDCEALNESVALDAFYRELDAIYDQRAAQPRPEPATSFIDATEPPF